MIIDPSDPLPRTRAILLIVGFCASIAMGPVLFLLQGRVQTRSTPPLPALELRAVLDGEHPKALEKHLVESSPVTHAIRGAYRDLWMGLGLLETGNAVIGRGGQLFLWGTLDEPRLFARDHAPRQRHLAAIARRAAALGVTLLLVTVPDTARVLPELLPEGREIPPARRALYGEVLAEARAHGIDALDLAAAMAVLRRSRPEEALYQATDTHWTLEACFRTAELVVRHLEDQGVLAAIPRASLRAAASMQRMGLGDLAEQTGLSPDGAFGPLVRAPIRWIGLFVRGPDGSERTLDQREPDAGLAVAGDSFADVGFVPALAGHAGRLVDAGGVLPAGGPRRGLDDTLARIERGELRARVVVWVVVERSFAEAWWGD